LSDKKKGKNENKKRGTIEKMKLLSEEEYAALNLHLALEIECMGGTIGISRLIDIEKQEAIGFLFVDNDGRSTAVVKENVWTE